MKIKRFVDKDMRSVLKRVRDEQGADAVILSNRRVDEGIEVIAALDYDEALMQHALGQEATVSPDLAETIVGSAVKARAITEADADSAAETGAARGESDQFNESRAQDSRKELSAAAKLAQAGEAEEKAERAARKLREAERAAVVLKAADVLKQRESAAAAEPEAIDIRHAGMTVRQRASGDVTLASMRAEISSLRGLLETQVSGLLWADGNRRSPILSQILRNLARMGVASDISQKIVERLGPIEDLKHIWQQPLTTLAKLLPVSSSTLLEEGGVVALIGPTGAGKTTTIAKLAANYAMHNGTDDIALVCADAYRIGAREHLTAFANILGIKVFSATDADDLPRVLAQLGEKKLVLIDTEGLSQRDVDLSQRLAAWRRNSDTVRYYLTLSSCSQEAALDETVRAFQRLPLAGAVVTKIDEAGQLGCVMSALIRHQLPLTWLTDGQNIPDDLHAADRHKVWLLKRAVDCINASQPRIDEHTMAENYGTVSATYA
ncbi:MAG: flagellar biosynthesis protein FlhF [Woeseia sp.]